MLKKIAIFGHSGIVYDADRFRMVQNSSISRKRLFSTCISYRGLQDAWNSVKAFLRGPESSQSKGGRLYIFFRDWRQQWAWSLDM